MLENFPYDVRCRQAPLPALHVGVGIAFGSGYFGGTWTYELAPVDNKTRVTITEQAWANPAFFRFMIAVFGADSTLKSCLAAIQKKHGG